MCGRTACTLAPDEIIQACGYMNATGHWVYPQWQDAPSGQQYYPSYNLAPSKHSPVLFSKACVQTENTKPLERECDGDKGQCNWTVQPMHWGLIPHWHHGDPKDFGYKMNNARSDGLLLKMSFKKPLEMGRRCVVLTDGYFEWKTSKDGKKQPFFIYFSSEESEKASQVPSVKTELVDKASDESDKIKSEIGDEASEVEKLQLKQELGANEFTDTKGKHLEKKDESADTESEPTENKDFAELPKLRQSFGASHGKRLLTMAGLYDIWKGKDGDVLYSYSVITVDAHPDLDFIHDRMPAILNGEDEVRRWLDYKSCPLDKALELIRPTNCLKYHPVSSAVNDSRNKSPECVQEIDLKSPPPKKISASGSFMQAWLKSGTGEVKRKADDGAEQTEKKMKL